MPEFEAFPKIPRLKRNIVVTEKIDGTNAQIHIDENGVLTPGSRNRWVTPEADNYGFAAWVRDNADELRKLGPGRHFGEWFGRGIQRGYGLDERRFYLFNTARWPSERERPSCVGVVPVLYSGVQDEKMIITVLDQLRATGSVAVPGFVDPEGIVIYHTAAKTLAKITLKNDEQPKGTVAA